MLALFTVFLATVPVAAEKTDGANQIIDLSGVWQADNGESRYALEWCGDNGTDLCATLTWIEPDKINDRNKVYLNTMVVDHARLVRKKPLTWQGKLHVYGMTVDGRVTLVDGNKMVARGCALLVFCVDSVAYRLPNTGTKTK